jgi:integrase
MRMVMRLETRKAEVPLNESSKDVSFTTDTTFEAYIESKGLNSTISASTYYQHVCLFFVFLADQGCEMFSVKELPDYLLQYKKRLDQSMLNSRPSIKQRNTLLTSLAYYVNWLIEVRRISIHLNFSLLQYDEPIFDDLGCLSFREYIRTYHKRNYTKIDDKIYAVSHFLKRLPISPQELEKLTYEHVKNYEKNSTERESIGAITKQTARRQLDQVKMFLNYLRNIGVIRFPYSVPRHLFGTETRDNEYVSEDTLIQFYETLLVSKKPLAQQNLCVFLLLVETGCRPIEICNLRISDFHPTESLISFRSIKSDRRVLQIDSWIKAYILGYLKQERKLILDNEPLFISNDGTALQSHHIAKMFIKMNKAAFGKIVFSAKTLRHTFITNALDEGNDITKTAEMVGHKQLRSTMHYFYRSVQRLVENTLPFDITIKEYRK